VLQAFDPQNTKNIRSERSFSRICLARGRGFVLPPSKRPTFVDDFRFALLQPEEMKSLEDTLAALEEDVFWQRVERTSMAFLFLEHPLVN
jgi:hypothetical protein